MPEMTKNGLRWKIKFISDWDISLDHTFWTLANISYVALFDDSEFRYFGSLADPLLWAIVFDSEVLKTETLK